MGHPVFIYIYIYSMIHLKPGKKNIYIYIYGHILYIIKYNCI